MSEFDNFDDMEVLDLDTTLAEVAEDLYLCNILAAPINTKIDEATGDKRRSIALQLEIAAGPYQGLKVKDWIGLDMTKPFNAKKLRNFFESVTGEKLTGNVQLQLERDDNNKVYVAGVIDEQIGAYLKSNEEGFINVTFKGYAPAFDPDEMVDGEEPF